MDACKSFLKSIGYLLDEGDDCSISTSNVDEEIAFIAGPQLVVPVSNARFCLNAANARWGSLYMMRFTEDAIAGDNGCERSNGFNERRANRVIANAAEFLDQALPLANGSSHADIVKYQLQQSDAIELVIKLNNGSKTILAHPEKFVAYAGEIDMPSSILCRNNGLHIY